MRGIVGDGFAAARSGATFDQRLTPRQLAHLAADFADTVGRGDALAAARIATMNFEFAIEYEKRRRRILAECKKRFARGKTSRRGDAKRRAIAICTALRIGKIW